MIEYINHVTLGTGHARKSYKGEINKELFFKIKRIFEESLDKNGVCLNIDGKNYKIKTTLQQNCGMTTLYRVMPEMDLPLLTNAYSDVDYEAFDLLQSSNMMPTKVKVLRPQLPYIVDRIEFGIMLDKEATSWTGDFSKCIGWIAIAGIDIIKEDN